MSHGEKCLILLFDGNNFDDWRFRVETRLEYLDSLDFAEKDCLNALEVTPLATDTADEKKTKKNNLQKGANVADTTLNDSDSGEFSLLADPASTSLPKGNEFVINCHLDSGATEIMVISVFLNRMTNLKELASPIRVKTAKANEILHATHIGDIKFVYIEDSIRNTISFTDILVVPELNYNLNSVRCLDQKGIKFIFFNGVASAYLQEKLQFKAVASYKMYEVRFEFNQEIANVAKDDDNLPMA
ncbi:hypothetical protein ILUMI_14961 [Ignelater luminosus]|uniref:Retrovirus-related Pol polyprotein from transposon TNT 1-94-like beta-barrel domain-containing protein n=1 Tax=Ignelater luminosus TaxID=2038154 RepID=A0A8K0CV17_IGNLU|nr:hypothetical protein ILUMI_14961 [Ignelater luminosus]